MRRSGYPGSGRAGAIAAERHSKQNQPAEISHDSEFLNADSAQLGDDAIRLNSEVEKLRSQNEKLQQQLATAQAQLQQTGQTGSQAASATETALGFNDEGLRLYKEKKYD